MKDSFILYNSFYEPIKALKNEQLGKLLRAIFDYTINGEITQDNEIMVAFMFIKNQIDLDTKKWSEEKIKRSNAGKKGMQNRWNNKNNDVKNVITKNKSVINDITNITDNVNENENVNVNENVYNKNIYYSDKKLNDLFKEFLQVRKKLKAVNSERAIQMLIKKLDNYDNDIKYKMIEQSIVHSWKDVYELKNVPKVPEWYGKEINKKEMSEGEVAELKDMLKDFN